MLFLESNTLNHDLDVNGRASLLKRMQERGFHPLIRSLRLRCFEDILSVPERVPEMEETMEAWTETYGDEPYVRGEVFSRPDHLLFLIFDAELGVDSTIRAGIIYDSRTPEPFRKLDAFCSEVREALVDHMVAAPEGSINQTDIAPWINGKPTLPEGFRNFISRQDADSLYTNLRKETMTKRIMAASRLEDEGARIFLRTAKDAHLEGYAAKLLTGESAAQEVPVERLLDAGLVEREVQISCRKTGHALFRLPNSHALAVVTVSDATCSECGAPVADENVEEVIAPTQLATSLLEDGSWLISRLHFLLREMGVPEREIALGPSEGSGYGQMMANICGESFLLLTRDGDLTPAFARWAVDLELETEASHLVIVATGRLHREAGVLLHNHSRRRVSGGQDFEMIIADDVATAGRELQNALERVSQRVIADQLCVLDSSIGLSVSRMVLTKFQMLPTVKEAEIEPELMEDESIFASPVPPLAPLSLAAHAAMNAPELIDVHMESEDLTSIVEPLDAEPGGNHLDANAKASGQGWE